CQQSNSWPLTF
nr:immunoglobulin light chain junction region [Mus musculus]NSL97378.1 immunoglobulin light chain junction region [Mus musculus]NSL98120.1 immunoglobulin light chain junction region [Mus musculus]NSL98497.1 immunoglobulin light chain junction region [Mus musculus]NSL98756.1 immunoglobulin light chain junction region [Mus musculus]